jgi:plastocyanin
MTAFPPKWSRLARLGFVFLVCSSLLLSACGDDDDDEGATSDDTEESTNTTAAPAADAKEAAVTIKTFMFNPSSLPVQAGTTVTWTNEDQILHTATSGTPEKADGTFAGPMDGAGTTFVFTFDNPGTFKYFCERHNTMTGEVIVS